MLEVLLLDDLLPNGLVSVEDSEEKDHEVACEAVVWVFGAVNWVGFQGLDKVFL